MSREPNTLPPEPVEGKHGVSRRGLIGWAGATTAVGAAAFVGGRASAPSAVPPTVADGLVAFRGDHQAGIVTPAQDRLHFAAFDVVTSSRDELVALLTAWTAAAEQMTTGHTVGDEASYDAPPNDTGDALDLGASNLTITFGFGPTLFEKDGKDRFGLKARQPKALRRLPHFSGDQLDAAHSDGDLCIQACAADPQVAVHAIRNLTRIAFGTAVLRWSQLGYGRTSSTSTLQKTPRNLFGFKDGTANLKAEDPKLLDEHLWVQDGDDPAASWLAGGSYLVARQIAMLIEPWDRASLREQEAVIGRDRRDGAPLSGGGEFADVDFALTGREGKPLVPVTSHVAVAHPSNNKGVQMLRRGYNYTDGNDDLGRLDAGLFFICFVRNPDTHYIPMQTAMASKDALVEYLQHRRSGLWAVPPGVKSARHVGQALFS